MHQQREETVTVDFALVAYQLATAVVDSFNFSSEASQVGMAAWFVSALVYCWLSKVSGQ